MATEQTVKAVRPITGLKPGQNEILLNQAFDEIYAFMVVNTISANTLPHMV